MSSNDHSSVVVIGASAGGVETLTALVKHLPGDFPSPVVVVLHLPTSGTSVLPAILNRSGELPAVAAANGDALVGGRIYVAPPDHHVLVGPGELALDHGPHENGHCPAIDTTFRTAALSYGERCAGVILSGTLDDGAAGLALVKDHGGRAIVQDPEEAQHRGMPDAARARAEPDHVVRLHEMPALLVEHAGSAPPAPTPAAAMPEPAFVPDMPDDGSFERKAAEAEQQAEIIRAGVLPVPLAVNDADEGVGA